MPNGGRDDADPPLSEFYRILRANTLITGPQLQPQQPAATLQPQPAFNLQPVARDDILSFDTIPCLTDLIGAGSSLATMKSLNVLNKSWRIGDTRDLTDQQLKSAAEADLYDSYDQTYVIDNLKWKIAGRMANPDGSTVYTLVAVKEAND
jgi:hypothetical protein